jgi:hypothetical protein
MPNDDGAKLEYLKKEKIIKNNMCLFFFVKSVVSRWFFEHAPTGFLTMAT